MFCGGTLNATTTVQTLTSPSFPNAYPPYTSCRWILDAPAQETIKVSVQTFTLQPSQSCSTNYLHLQDWPMVSSDSETNRHHYHRQQKLYHLYQLYHLNSQWICLANPVVDVLCFHMTNNHFSTSDTVLYNIHSEWSDTCVSRETMANRTSSVRQTFIHQTSTATAERSTWTLNQTSLLQEMAWVSAIRSLVGTCSKHRNSTKLSC